MSLHTQLIGKVNKGEIYNGFLHFDCIAIKVKKKHQIQHTWCASKLAYKINITNE